MANISEFCIGGWRITAQMRVLVAIEPVDGRKYAPSTHMWSGAVLCPQDWSFASLGRRITFATVWAGAWPAAYPAAGTAHRRNAGGIKDAIASSFSVGSALR
jgi:hypothetical protein